MLGVAHDRVAEPKVSQEPVEFRKEKDRGNPNIGEDMDKAHFNLFTMSALL